MDESESRSEEHSVISPASASTVRITCDNLPMPLELALALAHALELALGLGLRFRWRRSR